MRIVVTLFLLIISNRVFNQNNFAKQLNQIIKVSANRFGELRGEFKEMNGKDSVFYSTINLEGTSKNVIIVTPELTQYKCEIIDSVNERKGKPIVDEWHQELIDVLGSRFKVEKVKIVSWNPVKYGWAFKKGDTWVDIGLFPASVNSTKYFVSLAITHFSRDIYNVR